MRHWKHFEALHFCSPGERFIRHLGEEFLYWDCSAGDGLMKRFRRLPASVNVFLCSERTWGKTPKLWIHKELYASEDYK